MAFQPINNDEFGSIVRTKINEMFEELYGLLFGESESSSGGSGGLGFLWEIIDYVLWPKDDLPVGITGLTITQLFKVNEVFQIDEEGNIFSSLLSVLATAQKELRIDADGTFTTELLAGLPYEYITANKTLNAGDYAIFATTGSGSLGITLPDAATHLKKAYLIKRAAGTSSVILQPVGTDTVFDGVTDAATYPLASVGEWVKIRATTVGGKMTWFVESTNKGGTSSGGSEGTRQVVVVDDDYNIEAEDQAVMVTGMAGNVEVNLPVIETVGIITFTVRFAHDTPGHAVTVMRSSADVLHYNGVPTFGTTSVEPGAWIKFMSDPVTNIWYVIEGGTDWTPLA